MTGQLDNQDKNESRRIAIILIALVAVLVAAALLMLPPLSDLIVLHLAPGLGLKDAAIISFFITLGLMLVFALASGDGLLGEIQFILGGFFLFFFIIWLMISWIF
ncbi:hypothetical protein D5125_14490 [Magnetovirga frankeli]|uniref:hypothetical protein n=1 Tax=Magnetovirga frankeli TaxID=947516 RepID=UPI001AF733D5|nr:hypothetical protein D5125_14490 [gamma proteobacterium SS-5]